ncbi:related to conserved hypothetcial protein [Melanopsichium pennsylvanicum]|uniref:Mediator of RNA polymerase II transcription subunit 4 n=2 Tax=Melanopsichium pennsylvanicum TaxID=63383 RepID=A0AAJ4XRC1_9BASI|nr:conserved hypothetcial protein (C-terminal fragment) [Melanopsichium pennsylvanicum 4]SNX87049.1 related to conserved hypothetcial protein [Melanopsichium pennsylvanicum]
MQASAVAGPSTAKEPTTSTLLLSTIEAYSDLTKHLFTLVENPSISKPKTVLDRASERSWTPDDIATTLSAIHDVDSLLSSRIAIAHQHAVNQAKTEALQARAKRRDRETRQAILELSQMNEDLVEITRLSEEELASIDRAEKRPIGHTTLLSYAQRLAKYTSAPPGYKLPTLTSSSVSKATGKAAETKAEEGEGGEGEKISLGADYNQYAKRAAAYYDPAIPSMPQEMPFPSDAMMRQGILNSAELLNGAPMAEVPVGDGEEGADGEDEMLPGTDFAGSFSHLREQQQQHGGMFGEDAGDAFDLDLN